jgi:predicted nucleotidyltransferase
MGRLYPRRALYKQAGKKKQDFLYNQSMKRDIILSLLHQHHPELTNFGVKSLALFGSVACGKETPESDVDILVEYQGSATFDRFMDTKYYLEELLGCEVDLVTLQAIKPRMKPYILQDLIYAT